MPQLDVNLYQNDIGPFDGRVYAQAVKFTNVSSRYPEATRLHVEPTLNLPLSNGWASLDTEAKFLATHYQQTDVDFYNNAANGLRGDKSGELDESVNRTLPQFKVDGRLVHQTTINFKLRQGAVDRLIQFAALITPETIGCVVIEINVSLLIVGRQELRFGIQAGPAV